MKNCVGSIRVESALQNRTYVPKSQLVHATPSKSFNVALDVYSALVLVLAVLFSLWSLNVYGTCSPSVSLNRPSGRSRKRN